MEKIKNFPEIIQVLFDSNTEDCDPGDLLTKAEKLLFDDQKFEAFLLASFLYRDQQQRKQKHCYQKVFVEAEISVLLKIINTVSLCNFQIEDLKCIDEKIANDSLDWNIQKENIDTHSKLSCYEITMAVFIVSSRNINSILMLLQYQMFIQKDESSKKHELLHKVINFSLQQDVYIQQLMGGINKIACSFSFTKTSEVQLLDYFCEKMIELNLSTQLRAMYWYYSYLGKRDVSLIIFNALIRAKKEFSNPFFTENFTWFNFDTSTIREKYQRIERTLDGLDNKRNVSDLLECNKIISLIPLCLYAEEVGNITAEAFILWYAIRRDDSKRLIERMSEISGYKIPQDFIDTKIDFRGVWLTKYTLECRKVLRSDNPKKYIELVKRAYTVRPFDTAILSPLLQLSDISNDKDIENMLQYSINRTTSPYALGAILAHAIILKSWYGLKLVLSRLIFMKEYRVILTRLKKIGPSISLYDIQHQQLVREALDSYRDFIPNELADVDSYLNLNSYYSARHKKLQHLFSSIDKEELKYQQKIMSLLEQNKYKQVFIQLGGRSNISPFVLELILKAALKKRVGRYIILAYTKLVENDSVYASLYNLNVEPYFLQRTINIETNQIGKSNLISRVWGIPATLEFPVNRQALRVANFDKAASGGPYRKKLKF